MLTIGISAGDPAGIGLEVTLKALPSVLNSARWILFTDRLTFDPNYALAASGLPYRWIQGWDDAPADRGLLLMEVPGAQRRIPFGEVQRDAGLRATAYLEAASAAALSGRVQAIVTAPVNKSSIGPPFVGQTEFLAERAGSTEFAMAFFAPTLKVVLATIHLPLRQALAQISTDSYVRLIQLVSREFTRFGFSNRLRIAVAAINPHAGEGGMFGREDTDVLAPAVERCAQMGLNVSGPHSADSLYYRAHSGEFDVVIAPYHDQGLIPVKLIAHGTAVNVTLGLPYVRTSPDHGTAFAIAGKGVADASGMESAMRCAIELAGRR